MFLSFYFPGKRQEEVIKETVTVEKVFDHLLSMNRFDQVFAYTILTNNFKERFRGTKELLVAHVLTMILKYVCLSRQADLLHGPQPGHDQRPYSARV